MVVFRLMRHIPNGHQYQAVALVLPFRRCLAKPFRLAYHIVGAARNLASTVRQAVLRVVKGLERAS